MAASDSARARTWLVEIATELVGGDGWTIAGGEHKAPNQGGLFINPQKGLWHCFSASRERSDAVGLVQYLKKCGRAEARSWLGTWLSHHPGLGTGNIDESEKPDFSEYAKHILEQAVDPAGTIVEEYLCSRRLEPPYPPCVRCLPVGSLLIPKSHIGAGAIVGILTIDGEPAGVQLGFVDPHGRKSTIDPQRRRYNLRSAPSAHFDLTTSRSGLILIAEGLEDALSLAKIGD